MLRISRLLAIPVLPEIPASLVQQYRRDGYLLMRLPQSHQPQVDQLGDACVEMIQRRGANAVPKQEDMWKQRAEVHVQQPDGDAALPTPVVAGASAELVPESSHFSVAEKAAFQKKAVKMRLRFRNAKEVDRAYERFTAMRREAIASGRLSEEQAKRIASWESEMNRKPKGKRQRRACETELMNSFQQQQAVDNFQAYQSSGALDRDVKSTQFVDEAFAFLDNSVQSWMRVWLDHPAIRSLLTSSQDVTEGSRKEKGAPLALGELIGAAAGTLSGAVTMRLYDDTIVRIPSLANCLPVHFHGAFANFRDSRAVDAIVGLPTPPAVGTESSPTHLQYGTMALYRGSHHVVSEFTSGGKGDMRPFQEFSVFDVGSTVRTHIGDLLKQRNSTLDLVTVPPGHILFVNHLTLRTCLPLMSGALHHMRSAQQLAAAPPDVVRQAPLWYTMHTMPDGVAFDGERHTWMSKDCNGPLYRYTKGQRLQDRQEFPLLFSALDIE